MPDLENMSKATLIEMVKAAYADATRLEGEVKRLRGTDDNHDTVTITISREDAEELAEFLAVPSTESTLGRVTIAATAALSQQGWTTAEATHWGDDMEAQRDEALEEVSRLRAYREYYLAMEESLTLSSTVGVTEEQWRASTSRLDCAEKTCAVLESEL